MKDNQKEKQDLVDFTLEIIATMGETVSTQTEQNNDKKEKIEDKSIKSNSNN